MNPAAYQKLVESDVLGSISKAQRGLLTMKMYGKVSKILPKRPLILMSLSTGGGELEYEFIQRLVFNGQRIAKMFVVDTQYAKNSDERRQVMQLRPLVDELILCPDMGIAAAALHGLKPDLVISGNYQTMFWSPKDKDDVAALKRELVGCPHLEVINYHYKMQRMLLHYCRADSLYDNRIWEADPGTDVVVQSMAPVPPLRI